MEPLIDGFTAGRATMRVDEAAKFLGISRASAYRAAATGDLPVVRIGHRLLVSVAALEMMLSGGVPRPWGRRPGDGA
jgi:excisionase family DNA binding protein